MTERQEERTAPEEAATSRNDLDIVRQRPRRKNRVYSPQAPEHRGSGSRMTRQKKPYRSRSSGMATYHPTPCGSAASAAELGEGGGSHSSGAGVLPDRGTQMWPPRAVSFMRLLGLSAAHALGQ
jgi:hypothetical protein